MELDQIKQNAKDNIILPFPNLTFENIISDLLLKQIGNCILIEQKQAGMTKFKLVAIPALRGVYKNSFLQRSLYFRYTGFLPSMPKNMLFHNYEDIKT